MKRLKKFFAYLFCIDDWQIVWSESGKCLLYYTHKSESHETEYVHYKIYYSALREKYKLVTMDGEWIKAKNHGMYQVAMKKLIELSDVNYIQDKNIDYIKNL